MVQVSRMVLKPTWEVNRYRPANRSILSRSKTTAVSRKRNPTKIHNKGDFHEKKQHSSSQTAETAVP